MRSRYVSKWDGDGNHVVKEQYGDVPGDSVEGLLSSVSSSLGVSNLPAG